MINVGGRELPCRLSMGAMLLFKRNLQKDVSDMDANNIEELLMFMWCCVVAACKADGVEFDVDFETFCCLITPDDVSAWNAAMNAPTKLMTMSGMSWGNVMWRNRANIPAPSIAAAS